MQEADPIPEVAISSDAFLDSTSTQTPPTQTEEPEHLAAFEDAVRSITSSGLPVPSVSRAGSQPELADATANIPVPITPATVHATEDAAVERLDDVINDIDSNLASLPQTPAEGFAVDGLSGNILDDFRLQSTSVQQPEITAAALISELQDAVTDTTGVSNIATSDQPEDVANSTEQALAPQAEVGLPNLVPESLDDVIDDVTHPDVTSSASVPLLAAQSDPSLELEDVTRHEQLSSESNLQAQSGLNNMAESQLEDKLEADILPSPTQLQATSLADPTAASAIADLVAEDLATLPDQPITDAIAASAFEQIIAEDLADLSDPAFTDTAIASANEDLVADGFGSFPADPVAAAEGNSQESLSPQIASDQRADPWLAGSDSVPSIASPVVTEIQGAADASTESPSLDTTADAIVGETAFTPVSPLQQPRDTVAESALDDVIENEVAAAIQAPSEQLDCSPLQDAIAEPKVHELIEEEIGAAVEDLLEQEPSAPQSLEQQPAVPFASDLAPIMADESSDKAQELVEAVTAAEPTLEEEVLVSCLSAWRSLMSHVF